MAESSASRYRFDASRYEGELLELVGEIEAADALDQRALERLLRRRPKDGRGLFSKAELVRGFRHLVDRGLWSGDEAAFLDKVRRKPVRTASGVAPVTVLTKPYPCPGTCIFCPSDVRMPKSYLSDEPGAQRAAQHQFDPFRQTLSRLAAYHHTGHRADKVELIVLGGTWSSYPEAYQIWFLLRCFEAMNAFDPRHRDPASPLDGTFAPRIDYRRLEERVDGRRGGRSYNQVVRAFDGGDGGGERAAWGDLERAQRRNERARARCVGLVIETRPDELDVDEVVRLRRLGATKVQVGIQSLSDRVLALNRRGHDSATTRRALRALRQGGFKVHAHWMANLYGSDPRRDARDFDRLFDDPAIRPDELKIYPCSLIESAELMRHWEDGRWRPYERGELLDLLRHCLLATPRYCRLTRVIRDIPGTDIVAGNRLTNFRQIVEDDLAADGLAARDIRSREIRHRSLRKEQLRLREHRYETAVGSEWFLEFTDPDDRLAAFLRLSLPAAPVPIDEIADGAMIREVHTYGRLVGLRRREAGRPQHLGLGRALVDRAHTIARGHGYRTLAVISSVGTRRYYRRLGFEDGDLYQHRPI